MEGVGEGGGEGDDGGDAILRNRQQSRWSQFQRVFSTGEESE